jgi:hypothetical protein
MSLLSAISKVFEKVILKRFNEFLSNHNLPHYQFGFRAAYSASHQLNKEVRHIKINREIRNQVAWCFLMWRKYSIQYEMRNCCTN